MQKDLRSCANFFSGNGTYPNHPRQTCPAMASLPASSATTLVGVWSLCLRAGLKSSHVALAKFAQPSNRKPKSGDAKPAGTGDAHFLNHEMLKPDFIG